METTLEELDHLLNASSESQQLEFKEAKNQYDQTKLCKYCVAIANEGGGRFVLGVSDERPRRVVGTAAYNDLVDLRSKLLKWVGFRVEIEELQHPDGRVLVFRIPGRPRGTAYELDGAYFMRSGDELVPMTSDRLKVIFSEGQQNFVERVALENLTGADVVQLLDTQAYFDRVGLPYPAERRAVLERFVGEGLVIDKRDRYSITNLGALLFAKNLEQFDLLQRKTPRVIEYKGRGKLEPRSDQIGRQGLAVGFESLIDYINAKLPSNEVIERALRKTIKVYPEVAIRELLANAIVHQDLDVPGRVTVELYEDRVEISNPGLPVIDPARFIDGYQARNERMTDLMRRLKICEERSSGIDRVVSEAEVHQLPAPDFRLAPSQTYAVLFAPQPFDQTSREDRIRACYQHACLRCVTNQVMTNASLRDRFQLGGDQNSIASRIIRDTLERKLIKPVDPDSGSRRYTEYHPFWA
jgi:ATP-dependent DNA helicase RecG